MDEFTSTPEPVRHGGPRQIVRIGLVGAAAAAVVAAGILAFGFSAAPAGTLAAGTTDTTLPAVDVPLDHAGGPGVGPGFFGRGPGAGITITSISGNAIALETADGWTRTITVDSGTTYAKSGETIALGDLAVGDEIRFQQTRESDGSYSIDAVVVIPPHAGGTVSAISGSTITLTAPDGSTSTVTVTSGTTYSVNGTDGAALSDVTVGMHLMAEGTRNADGSLTATVVRAGDMGPGGSGHGRGHGPGGDWDGDGAGPDASAAPSTGADTSAG